MLSESSTGTTSCSTCRRDQAVLNQAGERFGVVDGKFVSDEVDAGQGDLVVGVTLASSAAFSRAAYGR